MEFHQSLEPTQLVKRYKRFLTDVIHPNEGEMTVHCPNTGSMKNCWQPGWTAWILDSQNPKRKYQYTWVLSENDKGDLIGINTHFANNIVYEAIVAGKVKELVGFADVKKEVKYGEENSRIDILLTDESDQKTFVEVKSVTLLEDDDKGYFPDAVTTRGQKHLRELMHCVKQGHRAVLFFLVQHTGINSVSAAAHIDPDYSQVLAEAISAGVEVLVYNTDISVNEIKLGRSLEFHQ
ncbi:DNA/RNA nuclease SfsA [Aliikangiella coralliicola]|uniref:Sugar fermentation stimulation protein homolog n=1 Tax=Aliikangiella coralliicola TaxID=2592383 RepID=A0A545UHU4_9GAMM|nr:DNA/RNA nuclease SfsA [Aliikangiella coralliicola]TQV89041.1 DNA/RNA nuclease SfsA [Aliikangiella coralliicola]